MTEQKAHICRPEDEADLVALADDRLPPARRAEVEARVAAEPALAAALRQQRAALALIAQLDTRAPLELRLRVEELKAARTVAPAAPPPLAARDRRWRRRGGAAALLVLVAGGGPAVDDALAVALRPATAPGGGRRPRRRRAVPAAPGSGRPSARAPTSSRAARCGPCSTSARGGRSRTRSCDGPALESDGKLRLLGGPGGRQAVTWTKQGHTCLISGSGVDAAVLRKLAAWR